MLGPKGWQHMPKLDETRPFLAVQIGVMTVSDTRTLADDKSGQTLVDLITRDGHTVVDRIIVKDDAIAIAAQLEAWISRDDIDVVIATGGTGVTGRDVTPEAFEKVYEKKIDGFGELFRWISFQEIGTSTIQSRAEAALCDTTYVFLLPGSPGACRTAMDKILIEQLDSRHKPCNFVELLPRIRKGADA
jgi:molybdenum cofactor biosynthesis protein B